MRQVAGTGLALTRKLAVGRDPLRLEFVCCCRPPGVFADAGDHLQPLGNEAIRQCCIPDNELLFEKTPSDRIGWSFALNRVICGLATPSGRRAPTNATRSRLLRRFSCPRRD
ncbi:hypothetical protein CUJ84_pRLN3000475 (plasmid) [Rhizobium leguminosarum]|uniref:Uncharacterized protein n=1 Tax=Rhizobium leguminosarum TaxID=384 RepID=A0A2K9ZH47_RHILE|nr:hypothetical protein CUJ84_pRLN3000475 [Rhizobium leguminosarum]